MKKINVSLLLVLIIFITLSACQHVDRIAQAAASEDIIDHDTANMISLSARAFSSASENISLEEEYFIGRAVAAIFYPLIKYGMETRS